MKFNFIIIFSMLFNNCFSQIEKANIYNYELHTSFDYDKEIQISTPITFTGEFQSIIKGNFLIAITSNNQPESNFNFTSEKTSDTFLYDLIYKKVYSFSDQKGMFFSTPVYNPGKNNIYNKAGTVIEFSDKIPNNSMPFPINVKPKKGLLNYKNKSTTITYAGQNEIDINFESYISRAKKFDFINKFMPNPY